AGDLVGDARQCGAGCRRVDAQRRAGALDGRAGHRERVHAELVEEGAQVEHADLADGHVTGHERGVDADAGVGGRAARPDVREAGERVDVGDREVDGRVDLGFRHARGDLAVGNLYVGEPGDALCAGPDVLPTAR